MSAPATAAAPASACAGTGVGATVWLTGLSGAGKSTIATALAADLAASGRRVEVLDGDDLRDHLSPALGFTRADRDAHVTRVGYLARLLARNGVIVLVPVIAPYAAAREAIRGDHAADGVPHLQVYIATDVDTCAQRDVKGLYAAQAAGRISGLTGVDDPYEPPTRPDLTLDTAGAEVADSVAELRALLTERGIA